MWPCCSNSVVILPNPCAGSSPCEKNINSDCVLINTNLLCLPPSVSPYTLTSVLSLFCNGFVTVGNEIVTINTNVTNLQVDQVFTTKVILTPALLQSIFSSPVILVPAPGAGRVIQVLSIYSTFVHGGTVFNLNSNTLFEVSYGGGAWLTTPIGLVAASGDKETAFTFTGVQSAAGISNLPLVIQTDVADLLNGTGTMTVYVTYKILSL